MAKRKVLILNLGWEQEPLLRRLDARDDLELYGIHYDDSYSRLPRYRDILLTDLRNLSRIMQFAEKIQPDAVISDQCDYSYFAQSLITQRFGLPGPQTKPAFIATNKYLQRSVGEETGIMTPQYKQCFCVEDIYEFVKFASFPVIVKPVDNRGSFGVNKVICQEEIAPAFYDAIANSNSRNILVEKFIDGTHLTIDGYVFDGKPRALALATKKKLQEKHSIIDGEIEYPGCLSPELYQQAMQNLENVAEYFGFRFGYLHGEFIIDQNKHIYLTEIANRGGGVFTSEVIVPNVSGLDVVDRYIADCLGETSPSCPGIPETIQQNPTVMKFFSFAPDQEGIIKRISGIDQAAQTEGVLQLRMLIHQGDYITPVRSGADRHGVIIVTAPTKAELAQRLAQAIQKIEVDFEKY